MSKTVLITGCSTGLGNVTAKKFANEGWNVVATMRDPDESIAIENPERIFVTQLDVTNPHSIEMAIEAGIASFGQIDAVVNNAGGGFGSIFESTPMDVIRSNFETNVFGVINVLKAIIPYFRKIGGGTIVNISSSAGFAAPPFRPVYTATKHAVEGLSESLSYELESQNISIKLVEPGFMPTTNFMTSETATKEISIPPSYKSYFDTLMQTMTASPGEFSDVNKVAEQVYYAACDESNRLRYPAGPDSEALAKLRWSSSEETYLHTVREIMGQTAWQNSAKNK
ncbi:3-oxoacyl-[acyl-carrier-protein] reductase FabG [Clostridium puniceum]|uniref:3-oxoacyl-[acyl-carrier-protein] reductase FabG n=1 Tax=Clostridium puniceum TaxID=29367 RepID=A0A1S8T7C8_9CLOT|nr:SDR family oxidoreductase [Clostridium puniceum]OOM73697.1 3-oxoacyl-[acyl-carrier-protein] reductase FabG [Clostridium puniceum]